MHKHYGRIIRLTKRVVVYVPRQYFAVIAECTRLRLEEVDKRPDLENRLEALEDLCEKIDATARSQDIERLSEMFDEDAEASLAYLLPIFEADAAGRGFGRWVLRTVAEDFARTAKGAVEDLKRRKKPQNVERSGTG